MKNGSGKARSVGAAAGGSGPNGAILDDTQELVEEQRKRFKAWKEGYRKRNLKPDPKLEMWYGKMSSPNGVR